MEEKNDNTSQRHEHIEDLDSELDDDLVETKDNRTKDTHWRNKRRREGTNSKRELGGHDPTIISGDLEYQELLSSPELFPSTVLAQLR